MSQVEEHTRPSCGAPLAPAKRDRSEASALESLLVEAGYVTPAAIDKMVYEFEQNLGTMYSTAVAEAWTDPLYRDRLRLNATDAIDELGFRGLQREQVIAVGNTDSAHNLVVCARCSGYPWMRLGFPPTWFEDPQYRSRVVIEPRATECSHGDRPELR